MGVLICLIKCIFSPIILPFQAFRLYILGCLGVYLERLGRGLLCGLCVCCSCTYKDKIFPASAQSIGTWKGKPTATVEAEIEWRRIRNVCAKGGQQGAKLFSGQVEANDICQGQLGDCWLMSALACLANQEGAVQRVFLTKEYTAYGKYKVRLYDGARQKWTTVVVDDWVPCQRGSGQAIFARPNGDEAWVLLLEKAMAKFKGSYEALDGGSTLWALEALTGDYVFKFKMDENSPSRLWRRYDLVHPSTPKGDVMLQPTKDELTAEEMFQTMVFYNRRRSVIAASSGSGNDTQNVNGIVQGHAYAIVAVREVGEFKMVQLRNPWGTFEWQGAWSDRSPLWQQYPKVAKALNHSSATDDGRFWMEWKDFQTYFKCLDFCMRTTGWMDLSIDIHEEHPCCGPTWGCIEGCCGFWCCCKGCRALFFAKQGRQFQRAPQGCCACVSAC